MALLNYPQQPQGGFLSGLQNAVANPLTLGGLGLLSGEGFGGAARGMQMGLMHQENEREKAERARQQAGFQGLLAQSNLNPQQRGLLEAAGLAGGLPVLLQNAFPDPVKPTDDMREYGVAKSQGFDGSFLDFLKNVKSFGAPQTTVNMPPMEKEYDKTMGGELAKEFIDANRTAATAQRDIANLDVLNQALSDPNLYTGTGGNVIQGIKKGAETLFGVPVKGTSSGEVMQNLASEIAVANKDKLPGPMSDADRQFLVDMAPNLSKTPEGNRLIIGLGMEHKRWQIERAKAARAYAAQNGGRLDSGYYAAVGDLDAQYEQKFKTILTQMRGMGQLAPRSPTVGVPAQYKQKYGLE